MPAPQRVAVALAEFDRSADAQTGPLHLGLQHRGGRQHATRKDVFLDEIHAALIDLPAFVLHHDDLQRCVPSGLEPLAQRVEIDRPVFFAHRLEHLDAGDPVIGAALVPVVLQLDLHPVAQAGGGDALHRIIVLRLADRQPGHLQAPLPRRIFRKTAPAAADFQNMIPGLCPHLVDQAFVFADLRLLQAFLASLEEGRGIGHRIVKPQAVEIIAQIIVIADVLSGLRLGIRLQPEAHPLVSPHKAHAGIPVIDAFVVFVDQVHEGLQIRRGPPAFQIGIAKAKIALADQTRKGVRVVDMNLCHRSGALALGPEPPPVGQHKIHPPMVQTACHLEGGGKVSWKPSLALCGRQCSHIPPQAGHFSFHLYGSPRPAQVFLAP